MSFFRRFKKEKKEQITENQSDGNGKAFELGKQDMESVCVNTQNINVNKEIPEKFRELSEEEKQLQELCRKICSVVTFDNNSTYETVHQAQVMIGCSLIPHFLTQVETMNYFIQEAGVLPEEIKELKQSWLRLKEKQERVKTITDAFMEKDHTLREQILTYSEVVKQINEKKLKGAEFQKVKDSLSPKLEQLNQERETFLKEEQIVNGEINELLQEMGVEYDCIKKIAIKIKVLGNRQATN